MTGHLIVTDEDATRVITLRRPEKKNAITQDMSRAMSDAIDRAQNNPDIRCSIITGDAGGVTRAHEHAPDTVQVERSPVPSEGEANKGERWLRGRREEAGGMSRQLVILRAEVMCRRIDQEGHLFGERMRSKEAISAFQKFFDR